MINFIIQQYKISSKKNLTKQRYIMNKFVLMNVAMKLCTFLPAYFLNKFRVSADFITICSYFTILISGVLFLLNYTIIACLFMIIFLFFDSLDGDISRLNIKKTKHGETMDIFGADIFYGVIPFSISYNLFAFQNIEVFFNDAKSILIIGFMISFSLIFYRLIGLRNYFLFSKFKSIDNKKNIQKKKFVLLKYIFDIFESDFIRGNFFSEPGFVLNFSILIILQKFQFLYYYLIAILTYQLIRLIKLFIASIIIYIK